MRCLVAAVSLGFLVVTGTRIAGANDGVAGHIAAIKAVSQEGKGQARAVEAARALEAAPAATAITILAAMDDANPLAMNWLRGVFEVIADRALEARELSAGDLEAFVKERSHHPRARRLAYEWLLKVDPTAEARFIPTMLNDPSPEMRRDAVAQVIAEAEQLDDQGKPDLAKEAWQRALSGVVDEDQFNTIAAALKTLGAPVDRVRHFGLLTDWYVIGPFDNREMKGFDVAYPPETEIDLAAEYEGLKGTVRWERYSSDNTKGVFDLAKLTAPHKGAVDYAFREFVSEREQPVEFRLATQNAWKLWLNGELLFAREEYHRGIRFDQYVISGRLKSGRNTLLLKVCQNEMEQDWAQTWQFQFRVCDLRGRAVHPVEREAAAIGR